MIGEIASTLLALALVLALAYGALRVMRRMQLGTGGAGPAAELRFLRALPVGPRERLVMVAYRGEVLLVGVSAGGINLLRGDPEVRREAGDDPS